MSAAILKKISESYHSVMVEPTFRFESLTDLKAKSNLKTCLENTTDAETRRGLAGVQNLSSNGSSACYSKMAAFSTGFK